MQFQVRRWGARQWIACGTIAFGTLFLTVALIVAGVSVSFLANAERARGTVVELEWRTDNSSGSGKRRVDNGPMAYPVVEFTSADGTRRTFESSTGSKPPSYETGERVEVLYHAHSPEDARINGFASLWLLPLVFGGLGLLSAGIGTAMAMMGRRRS